MPIVKKVPIHPLPPRGESRCVHIKVTEEQHRALRVKMATYELTTEDIFTDFLNKVISDTPFADSTLQRLVAKKLEVNLAEAIKPRSMRPPERDFEITNAAIYDIISGHEEPTEEDDQ